MVANKTIPDNHAASPIVEGDTIDPDVVYKRVSELCTIMSSSSASQVNQSSPRTDEALTELLASVGAMRELIQAQSDELQCVKQSLTAHADDHSRALEEAQALTHLGSWEWDIATDVITWSDELYRIYGMKPQERLVGFEEFLGLIHPDDRKNVEDIITDSFQTGSPFEFEHRIILPTGEERILKGMGKTVSGKDDKPVRMLGTSQDITQAKQLDRAKDEFISLVSHQLRTPLSIIRIHGNVLEDGIAGPLAPEQETHIRTMTSASIRLIELVDDILRISRISLNRIKINAAPADPNALIASCVEEAVPIARTKGTNIEFTPDASIGLVSIDTTIFGEILRNLVGNAVRYARQSNGKIFISFAKEADGYLLTVKDNGIGIPRADQSYIFERFYRANNATAVESGGSGLGLYIVKLFTEAAGGKIKLDSVEGKGATFYVSFPFHGMQPKQ